MHLLIASLPSLHVPLSALSLPRLGGSNPVWYSFPAGSGQAVLSVLLSDTQLAKLPGGVLVAGTAGGYYLKARVLSRADLVAPDPLETTQKAYTDSNTVLVASGWQTSLLSSDGHLCLCLFLSFPSAVTQTIWCLPSLTLDS